MQEDISKNKKEKVEKWLELQSTWFRDRLWQVVKWLQAEQELTGFSTFPIPLYQFKKKKIDLDEAKKITLNLENQEIVSTFKELGRTPISDDSNQPKAFIGKSMMEDDAIFFDPKTKIILNHSFKYLYNALANTYENTSSLYGSKLENFEWPHDPKKLESAFIFDENNIVSFKSVKSGRYKIFDYLFNAHGKFVSEEELSSKKFASDTKRTLLQIQQDVINGNKNCKDIKLLKEVKDGRMCWRISYKSPK